MPEIKRTWMGGYVTTDSKGRDVFCIRKQIGGKRFDVSTRCHTERAALEQLKKFEADPLLYKPGGDPKLLPLLLDAELATEFLVWSRDVKRNSPELAL